VEDQTIGTVYTSQSIAESTKFIQLIDQYGTEYWIRVEDITSLTGYSNDTEADGELTLVARAILDDAEEIVAQGTPQEILALMTSRPGFSSTVGETQQ